MSPVQILFFQNQDKMQLLNSKISLDFKNTTYRQQKSTRPLNLVLFCFVAFSYYFGGGVEES